ncbi:MAG: hypothetical protein E6R04_09120 [Spirochaetes bacterium]|jgi:hypothetical protein|nr:MAG: hypothetical protein E6R04_09120 [Spirochaetota bacterium]
MSTTGIDPSISEAHGDFDKLADPKVREAVERAQKTKNVSSDEAEKSLGSTPEIRAKYKIEVMFDKDRTTVGPNLLGLQIWESGKKFHGGGDELMYWCMDTESNQGCKQPIPGNFIKGPVGICPSCNRGISMERAAHIRVLRVTTRVLADELVNVFRSLKSNADIYLKYAKTDAHYMAMERSKGPAVARRLKGMHIYPLKNILKDTASGADLSNRFYAFLTS